jgi:hypothetical protein
MDITNKNVKIISIEMVVDNLILQKKKNEMLLITNHMKKKSLKFMLFRH